MIDYDLSEPCPMTDVRGMTERDLARAEQRCGECGAPLYGHVEDDGLCDDCFDRRRYAAVEEDEQDVP